MRTTITLDDEQVSQAKLYTGIKETGPLMREALQRLIHSEASRRLALLGATEPNLKVPPRKRYWK